MAAPIEDTRAPVSSGLPAPAPVQEPFRPVASGSGLRRTNSDRRPSRPRRTASDEAMAFVRGESHWLSEDEGVDQVHNYLAHRPRRTTRRPPHDHDDTDPGGHDEGGKADGASGKNLPSTLVNGHTHHLHNRPSMLAPAADSPIGLPSATALLSFMLVALECPACRETFSNPTTLACGHTVCNGCMTPDPPMTTSPSKLVPSTPPRPRSGSVSSSASRQRSPVLAATALLPDWLRRRGSTASEASSVDVPPPTAGIFGRGIASGNADLKAPARPTCPHPECHEVARAGPIPHPDVTLQKITALFLGRAPHKLPLRDRFDRMRIGEDASIVLSRSPSRKVREGSTGSHSELQRGNSGESGESGSGSGSGSGSTATVELNETGKRLKRPPRIAAKRVRVPEEAVLLEDEEAGAEGGSGGDAADIEVDESDGSARQHFAELVLEELECQVCTSIFVEPITTPCGHSFCRRCLIRSLDHSDKCPLCRSDMPAYAFFAHHALNHTLASFLDDADAFKGISQQRQALLDAEVREGSPHVPVFVCSISWPGLPTFLHVFEPRYRLMMRRAMETDRRFGMILPAAPGRGGGLYEYGTMLEIRKLDMLPDGRSVVETVGLFRFRVLEAGSLDGYSTAMVERIEDITAEQEAQLERTELASLPAGPPPAGATAEEAAHWAIDRKTTVELMADCRAFYDSLRDGLVTSWQYQRVNNTYGPMPVDPAEATFWFAQVLPIDDYQKAQLLPVTSPRLRLRLVVFWIEQLKTRWWYGNTAACTIM